MRHAIADWIGFNRFLVHPIVSQQILARQPSLLILLLCVAVPGWILTQMTRVLMLWPSFVLCAENHPIGYRATFFGVQICLVVGIIIYLSRRYALSIWAPQPSSWDRTFLALLGLLPLLLFHLSAAVTGIGANITLWHLSGYPEVMREIALAFRDIWGVLPYGTSGAGVILGSIIAFVGPVLEEIIFSGFLTNAVLRKYGLSVAVFVVPTVFALWHAPQFGLNMHLIPLFFAGLTYMAIRIFSGSVLLAIFCHCAINFVIYIPKWAIALVYFNRV